MLARALATAAAVLTAALLFAAALAAVALNWPRTVVNPATLAAAARHLAPFGVIVEWEEARTVSVSHGFLDKTFTIAFDGLCVAAKPYVESACASHFEASLRYRFRRPVPEVVAVGPVTLAGANIAIRIPEDQKKKTPETEGALPIPEIKLPPFLAGTRIFPVEISVNSFSVEGGGPNVEGRLDARVETSAEGKVEIAVLSGEIELESGESADLAVEAKSGSGFTEGDWKITARTKAALGAGRTAQLTANLSTEYGAAIDHDVGLDYGEGGMRARLSLKGQVSEKRVTSDIDGSVEGISEFVPRISLLGCRLDFAGTDRRRNRGSLDFRCPVEVNLKEFDMPEEIEPIYAQPRRLTFDVSAAADTFFVPDMDQRTAAEISLKLRPDRGRLVSMDGEARIRLEGIPAEPPERWKVSSDADIGFRIDKFAELVKVMSGTPWPVPAPLNVLDGSIALSLLGSASSQEGRAVVPLKLSTRLESEKQRIFVDSQGKLELNLAAAGVEKVSLELDVALSDLQLQLPNLSPAGLPALAPDGRIELSRADPRPDQAPSKPPPFDYRVRIATPDDNPLRVLSNLTPEHVPIALDLVAEPERITGSLSVMRFPVKIFTREASVERFSLVLREPAEKSEVSGKFSIPYIDIKILIELAGTVEQPAIILASDPPMSQGDIISTLMYGEPLSALDSDNADSVSNMNAAMANSAITLTSFFLLASTPIQSIGYNPDTRRFSARIRLAKRTSLMVGSSTEQKDVGIRQRLGRGWSITTSWEKFDDAEGGAGAAAAYLEWSRRY